MNKILFAKLTFILFASFFMMVGVLYFRNTALEARRRSDILTAPCITGIKTVRFGEKCRVNGVSGYRQSKFDCFGGSRGELQSRACITTEDFKSVANEACNKMAGCRVTPTPTPTLIIVEEMSPTPTPEDVPTDLTPTPTICAQPTPTLCEGGVLVETDRPAGLGVCGNEFVCELLTPTPSPLP